MNAGGTAGEDQPPGMPGENILKGRVPGKDFRIDVAFADAAGDQLGILAAEVQNKDPFVFLHNVS